MSRAARPVAASLFALALSRPFAPSLASEPPPPRETGPARVVIAGENELHGGIRPDRALLDDGAGGWWIGFSGPDSGARVVRVDGAFQRRAGFAERGRPLLAQSSPTGSVAGLIADGEGGVYALREDGYSVQTRRLLPHGDFAPGWEDEALHYSFTWGQRTSEASIVPLGVDGVMLAHARMPQQPFEPRRRSVSAQTFRADGSSPFLWSPIYAMPVSPAPEGSWIETCPDGAGGMYATWFERDTLSDSLLVRLIRMRPNSVPAPGWSARGTIVDRMAVGLPYADRPPRLASDGSGGVVVVWAHAIRGARAQRFSGDSLPQWGEGGRLLTPYSASNARIAAGPAGTWFVSWREFESRLLRIGADGAPAPGWTAPVPIFRDLSAFGYGPWIAPDGEGGIYAGQLMDWTAGSAGRPLRLHRLGPDGAPSPGWGVSGLVVPDVVTVQPSAAFAASPRGLLALWTRSNAGEYGPIEAVHVSPAGEAIDPATLLPPALAVLGSGPSPMRDDFAIRFRSGQAQRLDADVLDVSGRRVRVLERGRALPAGDHAIRWDGRDALGARVRPGLYLVRLRSTAGLASARVVAGL